MSYLLDTNVVSEATKSRPDRNVKAWLEDHVAADAFISVVTVGEIEQGITRLGDSKRAAEYREWLEHLLASYAGRVLPLDAVVMRTWGRITGNAIRDGRSPALLDSLLAATAIANDLVLVTRNTKDLDMLPVDVLNPWLI